MHRKFSVSKTQSSTGIGTSKGKMVIDNMLLYRHFYRKISDTIGKKATPLSQTIEDGIRPTVMDNPTREFNPVNSDYFLNYGMSGGRDVNCTSHRYQVVAIGDVKAFDMLPPALYYKVSGKKYEINDGYYHESYVTIYDLVSFYKEATGRQTATGIYLWMIPASVANSKEVPQPFTYSKELSSFCLYRNEILTENVCQRGTYMFFKQEDNNVNNFPENIVSFTSVTSVYGARKLFSALQEDVRKSRDMLVCLLNYFGNHVIPYGTGVVSFLSEICQGALACCRIRKKYTLLRNTDP